MSTVVVSIFEGSVLAEGSMSACVEAFESGLESTDRGTSRAFMNLKAPGSPTIGLSSMYSLPYRAANLNESSSKWNSCEAVEVGLASVEDLAVDCESCVLAIGVSSLLACVACAPEIERTGVGLGRT